jgi:hypothetical protein
MKDQDILLQGIEGNPFLTGPEGWKWIGGRPWRLVFLDRRVDRERVLVADVE